MIGGAAYYVLSEPAAKEQAKHDAAVVKDKVGGLLDKAEDKIDNLKVDKRTLSDKAHDAYVSQKNLAGSKPDQAAMKVMDGVDHAKAATGGWFGRNETPDEQAKRLYEEEKLKARKLGREVKSEVRHRSSGPCGSAADFDPLTQGKSLLNRAGDKIEEVKDAAASELDRTRRAASNTAEDVKQEVSARGYLSVTCIDRDVRL